MGVLSQGKEPRVVSDHELRRSTSAHVLMIPYPAQPHILPMLDLAFKLTKCGGVTVTFVSFQVLIDRLQQTLSQGSQANDAIHLVGVPDDRPGFSPPVELPEDPVVLRESLQLSHNLEPFLLRLLQDHKSLGLQGPTCLLTDAIHWWTIDVAARLNIPRYILAVSSASMILLWLNSGEKGFTYENDSSVISIPGLPPLTAKCLPTSMRKFPAFTKEFRTRWPKSVKECSGIVSGTCLALEEQAIDSVRSLLPNNKPFLPVGPLTLSPASLSKNVSMEGLQLTDQAEVLDWLDQQPLLSVIYVSFGTTGMFRLAKRHVFELARGLEASQQRFVWALRAPNDVKDDADFLPPGFEERVRGRGLLLRGWAPQLKILEHPSIGGFLSSCGWNSAAESLSRGVPIIGWPSFADQPLTCRHLGVVLKVAIELPQESDHFVKSEEIKKAIMVLLHSEEGKAVRERAATYKTSIAAAMGPGGTSAQAVEEFADLLKHPPVPAKAQKKVLPL